MSILTIGHVSVARGGPAFQVGVSPSLVFILSVMGLKRTIVLSSIRTKLMCIQAEVRNEEPCWTYRNFPHGLAGVCVCSRVNVFSTVAFKINPN